MPDKPHIFLIMTDQQKASATEHYGNPHVRTPNWSRVAQRGVTYQKCFGQNPICTPSRTSIMTGTYPLVHRVLCHQNHAPRNLLQLPELLREQGYKNLAFGHYESDRSLTRGWDVQIDMREEGRLDDAFSFYYSFGRNDVGWSAGEQTVAGNKAHAAVLNDRIIETLDDVDFDAQPVFTHVAYIEPHPPYFPPTSYMSRVLDRESDLSLPPRNRSGTQPRWHQDVHENYNTAAASDDDLRNCLAAYYGLIEYVDEQIGRLLDYIEARGIMDNSWIILTSDHGDYTGEKGCFTKTETPYQCLLHVPLVIQGPAGSWRTGESTAAMTELLDIFPTILNIAGCQLPDQDQGHNLVASDPSRTTSFSAVGEYHGDLGTTMPSGIAKVGRHPGLVRGARNKNYTYIRDPDYGDEAYDLTADPNELVNLLRNEASIPEGVRQLQTQMDDWEATCEQLRKQLGVIEGPRNFQNKTTQELFAEFKKTDEESGR